MTLVEHPDGHTPADDIGTLDDVTAPANGSAEATAEPLSIGSREVWRLAWRRMYRRR